MLQFCMMTYGDCFVETIYYSAVEAKKAGALKYQSTRACAHGHKEERYTCDNSCVPCKLKKERERIRVRPYSTEKYTKNRERILASNQNQRWKRRGKKPWEHAIMFIKYRARHRNKDYDLDYQWGKEQWTGRCSMTGIQFDVSSDKRGGGPFSPSTDRIDNSRGYLKDNCRFVLNCVNAFKGTMTDAEVIMIAQAIVKTYEASKQHRP